MSQLVIVTLLGCGLTVASGAIAWLVKTVIANKDQGKDLKLWAVEHFVAREDYVPQTTLISSKLDSVALRIERLDERLANQGKS